MTGAVHNDLPEASVCILLPTYNDAGYLGETIRSILAQNYPDFLLLILDNASDDDTTEVVAAFDDERIVYHRHPENLGFLGNLNYGFSVANGRYVVVQNSDDLWTPEFLGLCVARLDEASDLAAVHTGATCIDSDGNAFGDLPKGWPETSPVDTAFLNVFSIGFTFAAVMFRTQLIQRIGPLKDPAFARIADSELMLRTCLQGPIGYIDRPLCLYRVHDQGMSLKMYANGEFFRMHLAATNSAFDWPETQVAGIEHLRSKALDAVAMQSLKTIHLSREEASIGTFLTLWSGIVREAPNVLLSPGTWMRFGLGLLPRPAIRWLRARRRSNRQQTNQTTA